MLLILIILFILELFFFAQKTDINLFVQPYIQIPYINMKQLI
jgi:hypothetical protein